MLAVSGADLTHVQSHVTDLFAEYNRSFDNAEFRISTPAEYFEQIKDSVVVNAELADALAVQLGGRSQAAQLARTWEGVLFNQFHDIICGSHVDKVYVNTIDRYKAAGAAATECLEAAFDDVVARIDTQGKGIPLVVFNPLSWNRDDVVEYRIGFSEQDVLDIEVRDSAGTPVPHDLIACKRYNTGGIKRATALFICRDVPALGYEVYRVVPPQKHPPRRRCRPTRSPSSLPTCTSMCWRMSSSAWRSTRGTAPFAASTTSAPTGRSSALISPMATPSCVNSTMAIFWEYNGHCKGDALYPMNRARPPRLPGEFPLRRGLLRHPSTAV